MRPIKAALGSSIVRAVLCWLGAQYIRLVWLTGRWRVVGGETAAKLWAGDKPFILCFWHGRLLMMPYSWNRGTNIRVLISSHRDGKILSRLVGHFGIPTVTGSTTRGGTAALRAMLKALAAGECVGITPDGPRGPRMRASDGIIHLARLAGVPVLPVTFSSTRRRLLGSWDRFVVALPLARGVIVWGEAIAIARDASPEEVENARANLEEALNRITAEADRLCGHDAVEPAPPVSTPPGRATTAEQQI